ncbi:MAG: DUF2877 domain-containing protein [Ardenticatenales bacterium]|nr:DUF2877 domain-containing protein [Ardenticatenales bacterium]
MLPALSVATPVVETLQNNEQWFWVHSSFKQVLNLQGEAGQLISLLTKAVDDGPFSIRLPLTTFSFYLSTSRFYSDGTMLVGSVLKVQWGDAPRWNPALSPGRLSVDEPMTQLVRQVAGCLSTSNAPLTQSFFSLFPTLHPAPRRPLPHAGDRLWKGAGEERLAALHRALLGEDDVALGVAAMSLLGWGTGLTPAGDDCLLGLLAGCRMVGRDVTSLQTMIQRDAAPRTTSLSAALLQAASVGHFSASWHRLALALERRAAPAVDAAARHLMAHGASSGADALVGWLLALLPQV